MSARLSMRPMPRWSRTRHRGGGRASANVGLVFEGISCRQRAGHEGSGCAPVCCRSGARLAFGFNCKSAKGRSKPNRSSTDRSQSDQTSGLTEPLYDTARPGESILLLCLEPLDHSIADAAAHTELDEAYLAARCEGRGTTSADLAIRLEQAFGVPPTCGSTCNLPMTWPRCCCSRGHIQIKPLEPTAHVCCAATRTFHPKRLQRTASRCSD